jgi:putative ABC transport system substrate-binding protein
MKRRQFITLLGSAAAWPVAARAQQGMPVIGYFYPGSEEANITPAFRKGLSEVGFVEGRNVAIEYRFGRNDPSQTSKLVADLVRRKVNVIAATGGATGALAAKAATTTIPIVFEIGNDPVEAGLVESFNRPGGNVTGLTAMNLDLDGKRLRLLAELAPAAKRIGYITTAQLNTGNPARFRDLTTTTAAALGRQIEVFVAADMSQVDAVFASFAQRQIDALYVSPSPIYDGFRVQIATAAARYAVPTVYPWRSFVDVGGLISYGADQTDDFRIVGTYAGRILKGERPADLPVQRPSKFEFVINLHTAKLLGLVVPASLLASASDVIE